MLLDGLRVLDLSTEIAGPYATKLLADAGADVVKLEGLRGDPLRRWTASGHPLDGCDGALFRYLNASKRSVVGTVDDPKGRELVAGADVLVEGGSLSDDQLDGLRQRRPDLVVASVTPFGRRGPLAGAPATEFTLQAWCGSTASRGNPDRAPLYAGGRLGEWIAGVYTAVGSLGALRGGGGGGEHIDVSMLECMAITMGGFSSLYAAFTGMLDAARTYPGPVRSIEVPSIYPTADGLVGFCTVTGQQFQDFLVLLDRADLIGDERFATAVPRMQNREEFDQIVTPWTSTRITDEIIELASAFRIPVTAIGTPETITTMEQFVARGVFVRNPGGGFVQPRVPYLVEGVEPRPFQPAPILDADHDTVGWDPRPIRPAADHDHDTGEPPPGRPLDGVRIVDLTAFWAGPSATQVLAAMGADVIKVEGLARPDGMRFNSARRPGDDLWWEVSPVFHAVNTGKRAITLDLGTDEGRALLFELVERADGVIENFSPRVLDGFGITWKAINARNPRAVMVRMPSFGLDGPWRERTGFAQTMEQVSGMAWVSGYADDLPVIPRGPCDPLAGMHAAMVFLAALAERDRSGVGRFVEVSMVEAALNCAAEVVIEHTAYRSSLHRDGNRGPVAAPQGVYACRGREQWLALAVVDDWSWRALSDVLGGPTWASDERFADEAGRREHHDDLDGLLTEALAERDGFELVDALLAAGVAAAPVLPIAALHDQAQLRARGFFEAVDHSVVGTHEVMALPFRLASRDEPWFDRPAPTLGQHNREVLGDVLGLATTALDELEADGVIGTAPPT
jgi:crotonobetainyl-CoA:carnitine CoA-transferase CaiB-like acyl-CoA transferase